WMGLLRRPTPGEIVEDGRFSRPCGSGALSRAFQKTNLRLRRHSRISPDALPHLPLVEGTIVAASPQWV
ncbi:MAG: hypothetical protein ACJ75K_16765, partial [Actinomycetes bacterium]